MGSSHETGDLSGDQRGARAENLERGGEGRVALVRRSKERVVGRPLLRLLPDTLDRVELWGVRRQAEQLQPAAVGREPDFAIGVEVVAGAVVDHQKDLPPRAAHQELQELKKGLGIEDGGELILETWPHFERQRAKEVRRLAHAERVDARLHADAGPRLVQRPIEPEAGLVFVHDYAVAGGGFL